MSGPVRTMQKRMLKRRGWRRALVQVGFDQLLREPIRRHRIIDGAGAIVGERWPVRRAGAR